MTKTVVDDLTIECDNAFVELTQDDDHIVLQQDQVEVLKEELEAWLAKRRTS